ncbi:E3 SUMO-protein ligase ZBED1-like [Astyanax mexicanus]|uniref:E3 SUMO-protein ligase ZBED1-like n=1 Tax=Astyanax mexicanus TaxID=7994 RepID=UPI0020CB2562|nr:E3 SUMO-protein ligase ZBED1-like [Astyanax mexicanus]
MLRHYRARHEKEESVNPPVINPGVSRKQAIDEAVVNMIITDCQPLSLVEDVGFRDLLQLLEPSYVLPSRKAIKTMISQRYEEKKEQVKKELQSAVAVSLTADMWTSINMEAYLAVTCHYVDSEDHTLCTSMLGVQHFPQQHTAENMAQVTKNLMEEWAIAEKVTCLVTDAAANMIACVRKLQIRHTICIAHSLNLTVRKSCDQIETFTDIRHKTRQIVTYFRTSTTAKEKLTRVQLQMGGPVKKLINEVSTRWNSTYLMLERIVEQKESVLVSLASLKSDLPPLTTDDYKIIEETLGVLAPFNQATVELSEEKRVSGSKVIPMLKMLHHSLLRNASNVTTEIAINLVENLKRRLLETLCNLESLSVMTIPTLLDPRFKTMAFLSVSKANDAVKRLKSECVAEMKSAVPTQMEDAQAGPSTLYAPSSDDNLWQHLDMEVKESKANSNVTTDAIIEVQRYLSEVNTPRSQDPLQYWKTQRLNYPTLYKLAIKYLCTPSSSVPCERVFSKTGEIVCKRRNRLGPNLLKQLMFLNKNV